MAMRYQDYRPKKKVAERATSTAERLKLSDWVPSVGSASKRIPSPSRRTISRSYGVVGTTHGQLAASRRRGELVSRYRKIRLCDVDMPGGGVRRESDSTARGALPVVVEVGGAPVGVTICYDVRFPELYRRLVKDMGAEVLLVPAAFTAHTGAAHWHLLLRARAIEDQAWVVAAAQWGRHSEKRESYGHTLIVDPWGTIAGERAQGD